MKRDSRRLFSSVENLGKLNPKYLVRLAHRFPDDFKELMAEGVIPQESKADKLDLSKLVPVLTNRGVSEELGDALFLINAFSTPYWRQTLSWEVNNARPPVKIVTDETTTDADYAIMAWLERPLLLESALARQTLKSKRTFHYYTSRDLSRAAQAPRVSDEMIEHISKQLRLSLKKGGVSRGVQVIPFIDDADEDWFLIRRVNLPEKISFIDEHEEEKSITVMAKTYDVVVYDRTTGMLKVNTRFKQEELYRMVFSDCYFRDITFFEKKEVFTLESFRNPTMTASKVPGITIVDLNEISYEVCRNIRVMQYKVYCKDYYQHGMDMEPPVPEDAQQINYACLTFKFDGRKQTHSVRIRRGNVLSYCRDDLARPVEKFLQQAGIMINVQTMVKSDAA